LEDRDGLFGAADVAVTGGGLIFQDGGSVVVDVGRRPMRGFGPA
jgi:hypothetical protein